MWRRSWRVSECREEAMRWEEARQGNVTEELGAGGGGVGGRGEGQASLAAASKSTNSPVTRPSPVGTGT